MGQDQDVFPLLHRSVPGYTFLDAPLDVEEPPHAAPVADSDLLRGEPGVGGVGRSSLRGARGGIGAAARGTGASATAALATRTFAHDLRCPGRDVAASPAAQSERRISSAGSQPASIHAGDALGDRAILADSRSR